MMVSYEEFSDYIRALYKHFLQREIFPAEIETNWKSYQNERKLSVFVNKVGGSDEAKQIVTKERLADLSFVFTQRFLEERTRDASLPKVELSKIVQATYELAFMRQAASSEVDEWLKYLVQGLSVSEFVAIIAGSEERVLKRGLSIFQDNDLSEECLARLVYERILGRGASATEIGLAAERLRRQECSFPEFLQEVFFTFMREDGAAKERKILTEVEKDGSDDPKVYLLGSCVFQRLSELRKSPPPDALPRLRSRLPKKNIGGPSTEVSAIASMYKGRDYIERLLSNFLDQTICDASELIIVDAASPDEEYEIIAPYFKECKNIKYHRTSDRIGIYAAWNIGIKMSQGRFLTNVNMDDLRRSDSFEIQRSVFEHVPFVDIAYQDFYYHFEDKLAFEEIERLGVLCRLPIVTTNNLVHFNSPHNAPMWRRKLHDDVGWFDERYRSAGDCDFWLRCAIAGKTFFKSNVPHVAYYWNPFGLSTNAETLGISEHREIITRLSPSIVPKSFTEPYSAFRRSVLNGNDAADNMSRYELVQAALLLDI